ncbi:MAG TPA: PEP-CTERM sorting domain-containing protein [Phycisphaerae bacterium]|nr:PEP-CTERM sorting domain-containing protein [Phycisphaerae bacterium]
MKINNLSRILIVAIAFSTLSGLSASNAMAAMFYGYNADFTALSSYPSAANFATNTSAVQVGTGAYDWEGVATDGVLFYGYDKESTQLFSYPSAADFAWNTNVVSLGTSAYDGWEGVATDGVLFYAYDADTTQLFSYPSAADFAWNTNVTSLGTSVWVGGWDGVAAAVAVVPEPSTFALALLGLLSLGIVRRRRR